MTIPLNPEILQAAYDYLTVTPPFVGWNLPDSDDVKFVVSKSPTRAGLYLFENSRHIIHISSTLVGHTNTLMCVMAHEMVHVHQSQTGMFDEDAHSGPFLHLAKLVSRFHGFDPRAF